VDGGGESKKIQSAVALKYEPREGSAPVIVAKGKGRIAEKIIEIAREKGIVLYEDPLLIEILGGLDLGEEIPQELYQIIAEILAFVYRLDETAGGAMEEVS
jgi:flagellar biosynthesis protein